MIFLGADHAGFETKDLIKEMLHQIEIPFEDLGAEVLLPGDDYVDYAQRVAVRVARGFGQGILVCDTGIGMDMAANKIKGVRAALCTSVFMAQRSKEHENANILVLGAAVNNPSEINEIVRVWLDTQFSNDERHIRRLKKIEMVEKVLKLDQLAA
ncbi:MAG: RpiB/LacA/LacB family sugar-phosphate isomerase [bacterium]|nr:RpiB/LacA/LacB family sugar-phosphate isomerase [bacterium]